MAAAVAGVEGVASHLRSAALILGDGAELGLIETVATDRPPATGSHGGAWVEDLGCAQ